MYQYGKSQVFLPPVRLCMGGFFLLEENPMKFIYILASLILLQTCSCQGQPTKPIGTGPVVTSEPPPPYMPSLIGDSVLVDTLSPFLKNALRLRYTGDPAIVSFRVTGQVY
jgi:hypothetical protein